MRLQHWVKLVERESDFWKNYMMIASLGHSRRVFGIGLREHLTTRHGMAFTHWMNVHAAQRYAKQIERQLKRSPTFLRRVETVFCRTRDQLLAFSRQLQQQNLQPLSNAQLLGLYQSNCRVYQALYPPFNLTPYLEGMENALVAWLQASVQRSDGELSDCLQTLVAPPYRSPIQEEERDLLRLALRMKQHPLTSARQRQLLDAHVQRYAGLPVIADDVRPWRATYFKRRLTQLMRQSRAQLATTLAGLTRYHLQVEQRRDAVFYRLGAPAWVRRFSRFIGLGTWIRLTGRATFARSHHATAGLFTEIGQRHNLRGRDVKWLIPAEVEQLIRAGRLPTRDQLADRQRASALHFHRGKCTLYQGHSAERFIEQVLGRPQRARRVTVLRGTAAFPGHVRGKVCVVQNQHDLTKFHCGEVLVARMTTMDILPAVRQASAIVTDEGGLTCHAAIVAREMKKPCIIGTRIATRMFKNGDTVEVDANRGIVRKI